MLLIPWGGDDDDEDSDSCNLPGLPCESEQRPSDGFQDVPNLLIPISKRISLYMSFLVVIGHDLLGLPVTRTTSKMKLGLR